ncbi:unnamed protein product [Bursaphelenchus okinawaensis]|uniref:Uncharacterized protein n=1 Tax=Bursaphelenchus okinawaensis TaxID=465554 RepID=A0A811KVX2_9BILA|nr:unnamed protein product [Bursaphelenchus okinawaensis]CAG9112287.1 unnamed protein product [Bursaphelenchus okinawaensis]
MNAKIQKEPENVVNPLDKLFAKAAESKQKETAKTRDPQEFLKSLDPLCKDIVIHSKKAALYKFVDGKWSTTDIAGPLFLYKRLEKPNYSLIFATKSSHFIRPVTENAKVEFKSPFIFLHLKKDESLGICFKEVTECPKFFEVLTSITKGSKVVTKADNALNKFLNKSEKEVTMKYSEKTTVTASYKSHNVTKKVKTSKVKTFTQSELVDVSDQNLKCIKMIDPFANAIVSQASHGALYNYNVDKDEWVKSDIGGPFFVYSRKEKPAYSYMIANRQSFEDWIQPITKDMRFECNAPYIFTNIPKKEINALWFGDDKQCLSVYKTLTDLKNLLNQPEATTSDSATGSSSNDSSNILDVLFPQTLVVKVHKPEEAVVEEVDNDEEDCDDEEEFEDSDDTIGESYHELQGSTHSSMNDDGITERSNRGADRPVTVHTAPKVLVALFGSAAKG